MRRLRRDVMLWRGLAAAAGAGAAALSLMLVLTPTPTPMPMPAAPATSPVAGRTAGSPVQAASLSAAGGGRVVFLAVLDPDRGELVLAPARLANKPGSTPELWAIPAGGKPIALGLGRFDRPVRLRVRGLTAPSGGGALAVSLEPSGGSPTGQPTGPVIATGPLQAL